MYSKYFTCLTIRSCRVGRAGMYVFYIKPCPTQARPWKSKGPISRCTRLATTIPPWIMKAAMHKLLNVVGVLYCGVLCNVPSVFLAGCRRPVQKEQFENTHPDWSALPPLPSPPSCSCFGTYLMILLYNTSNKTVTKSITWCCLCRYVCGWNIFMQGLKLPALCIHYKSLLCSACSRVW